MLPDRIYPWLETLGWVFSSMIVGAMWGWFISITSRELIFYIMLGLGLIWFIRLYQRYHPVSVDTFLTPTSTALVPAPKDRALQTIVLAPQVSTPVTVKMEILSPPDARQWLDEFLVKQQRVQDQNE